MATSRKDIRVLFWGMSGEFSYLVLEGLLNAEIDVCAVVTPSANVSNTPDPIVRLDPAPSRSQLPISQPYLQRTVNHLAWQKQIPVYEVNLLSSTNTSSLLATLKADAALVACFPRIIPPNVLATTAYGFLNLHPSLLPQLRGPFPLFWSFRLGLQRNGVTVHYMDAHLDSGDIALQQEFILPDGISGPQADALAAGKGASLMVDACRRLSAGTLPRIPQGEAGSSYPRPSAADFQIPTNWSARHAFNFIRGTAEWGYPFHLKGSGLDQILRRAISFEADASQSQPLLRDGRDYLVQFSPGVLRAR